LWDSPGLKLALGDMSAVLRGDHSVQDHWKWVGVDDHFAAPNVLGVLFGLPRFG
jgi:hypothetical protein